MNTHFDSSRFDPHIVHQLGRIDLIAREVSFGVYQGLHRSPRRGFSTEFNDFRPYTPNDDLRFLDWRLYARTDRLFVKCFEAETTQEALMVLDASRSMAWRWEDRISKLEYSANLLAALAGILMRQRDPVGLVIHDAQTLHALPPRASRTQLEHMCAVLSSLEPGSAELFPFLVEQLTAMRRHRGLLMVCADLEEDEQRAARALVRLAATGDEIILFHVLDEAEVALPFSRDATYLEDVETGEIVPINRRALARRHRAGVRDFRERWRKRCAASNVLYMPVHTGMNYVEVIHALLRERELRR